MIFLNLCCVPQKRTTSSLATKSICFFGSHPIRFEGSSSAAARKKRKSVETVICSDEDFIISEHEPIKFIYPKYKTQINLVTFCFWGPGSTEKFCHFSIVSYFWGCSLSCFHVQNIYKILFFVDCRVRTKRLIDINVKKVQ